MSVASLTQRSGGVIGTIGPIGGKGVWSLKERGALAQDFYDNVSLYLKMNGANGSTTFYDSSKNGHVVTANGNAQISTAQSKFGGASAAFDGTGDYLSIADSNSLDLGTGDFTLEMWAYIQSTGEYVLYAHAATGGPMLLFFNGSFAFRRFAVANVVTATAAPARNKWVHIAACRSGTSTRLFFDGVQTGSTATDTANYTVNGSIFVGIDLPDLGALPLNGYIDDLRITKGVARYTGSFTPPARQFRP